MHYAKPQPGPDRCTNDSIFRSLMVLVFIFTLSNALSARGISAAGNPGQKSWSTFNLGPQLPGQILTRRVVVSNGGSATLRFSKVITSCGCLNGDLQPAIIPPGKTATLRLKLTTHDSPGAELVTALLYGRAGSTAVVRQYRFKYSVHRMIMIAARLGAPSRPYYLNLGAISDRAMPSPFGFAIKRGGYPARWDSLRCSANTRGVAVGLRQRNKDTWLLSLVPKNLAILGSQSYMLRFSFYRKGRELRYHSSEPVNFKVRGPVEIEPGSVFFGAVPLGSTLVKRLHLVSSKTGQSGTGRILSVKSTDPKRATVAITEGGKGLRAVFRAVGTDGQATGRFLVVTKYHGEKYQFRIDYLADIYGRKGAK